MADLLLTFRGKVWLYEGESAWHFVSLPKNFSADLKKMTMDNRRGFGSLRVMAETKNISWTTSIFPDNKSQSYLLPIKSEVRSKASIKAGQVILVSLRIFLM